MTKMIDIQHLKKTFGKNEVLKDISASVEKGQVICIIGPPEKSFLMAQT